MVGVSAHCPYLLTEDLDQALEILAVLGGVEQHRPQRLPLALEGLVGQACGLQLEYRLQHLHPGLQVILK